MVHLTDAMPLPRRLLDLYCGVGGAAMGYALAGFSVFGVDNRPQPHYPFQYHLGDALEYLREYGHLYDVIHASPPCQAYTVGRAGMAPANHPDLLGPTREALVASGRPWVIENVPGAPMDKTLMLCGEMFGLGVLRHRFFESNLILPRPHHPRHRGSVKDGTYLSVAGHGGDSVTRALSAWREVLEIPWAETHDELVNAIPPAYTEWLGWQILGVLDGQGQHVRQGLPHQVGQVRPRIRP